MSRSTLEEIAKRYGLGDDFGHYDYEKAVEEGYSKQEILNWLNEDKSRLAPGNRPGGADGLYDQILSGNINTKQSNVLDRGAVPTTQAGTDSFTPAAFDFDQTSQLSAQDAAEQYALQELINKGNAYTQGVLASASMYGDDADTLQQQIASTAQERANKYDSFMDAYAMTTSQAIKTQGDVNIKELDNAGRLAVTESAGAWNAANSAVEGEYANERQRISGQYQKDVAKINKDASIFGSLIAGFW
jgi:hypothetical protein